MINKKRLSALVAKALGGIAFLSVFVLNVLVFVQKKDAKASSLSLMSLSAQAQSESGGSSGNYGSGTSFCGSAKYSPNQVIHAEGPKETTITEVKTSAEMSYWESIMSATFGFTYYKTCKIVTETKNCVGWMGACCDQSQVGTKQISKDCN